MPPSSVFNIPHLTGPEPLPGVRDAVLDAMGAASANFAEGFGRAQRAERKESQSSVVTETDMRSEAAILAALRARFPDHSFLAEESGFTPGAGRWTWIIDPLDGTSNFTAGIPWFAVMLALVEAGQPVAAAISLPAMGEQYYTEHGAGAYLNGTRIHVSREPDLANMLVAYGLDWNEDAEQTREEVLTMGRLVAAARNVRAANCVMEDCFVATGRLGAAVNRSMKLWDLAPAALIVKEAGGVFTDLEGRPHDFNVTDDRARQTYTRIAATPAVHAQVVRICDPKRPRQ